ncbi:TPA: cell wall hydrolase [Burkholderia vietnamiensis]|nr:cell wall hydrolase [Burkholderia vietnamiensis]
MVLASALMCLALNVYFESRSEPILGQYAVAAVTMNRADDDTGKVCEVVTKPHQFSWTTSRVRRRGDSYMLVKSATPKDDDAWATAKKVAWQTLHGHKIDVTHGATFYHANYVRPAWRKGFKRSATIGKHIFYTQT